MSAGAQVSVGAGLPVRASEQAGVRRVLLLAGLLGAAGLVALLIGAWGSGTVLGHFGRGRLLRMLPLLGWTGSAGLAWLLAPLPAGRWLGRLSEGGLRQLAHLGHLNWVGVFLPAVVFPALIWGPWGGQVEAVFPRVWIFGVLVMAGAACLAAARREASYSKALAICLLGYGVFYQAIQYLPQVNNDPISLGWSEASRYYYASLFFARSVYGQAAALPFLHPSRYLMQSLPFALQGVPIWVHRAWQVILWLGVTGLAAWLLVRRLGVASRLRGWLLGGWAFLFFFQGPVYYHLMVCAILVLAGFDRKCFWRSLAVVVTASLWAGISRVNWFPVPGMLAAALYLLEARRSGKSFWRYWLPPVAWVGVGLAAALAAQAVYIALSGNPSTVFGSSFKSPLLWYRLFPSATYPLGVLPGIALAALPLALCLLRRAWQGRRSYDPLRLLGLAAILGALFGGGMVVSVKIGGGSNLHNLDAFLVLLAVIGVYVYCERAVPDGETPPPVRLGWAWMAALLVPAAWFAIHQGGPLPASNQQQERADIASLQALIDERAAQPGEVVFINQRQLVTFQTLHGASLVPEYENVDLMEMAMANNRPYLDQFAADLRNRRFKLIVVAPLNANLQDEGHNFGEENNAWVRGVVEPVLGSYTRLALLPAAQVEVLQPK